MEAQPDPMLVQPPAQPPPPDGVVEVTFEAGPLGVGVGHLPKIGELTGYFCAAVNFPDRPDGGMGQAARYNYGQADDALRLQPGMLVVSVDGTSTHGQSYAVAVARLKAAERPVVLGFASQRAACEAAIHQGRVHAEAVQPPAEVRHGRGRHAGGARDGAFELARGRRVGRQGRRLGTPP